MNIPGWLKPGIIGGIVGAIAITVVGFSWGGWVTSMKSRTIAEDRATAEVLTALVPFCIAQSRSDPDSAVVLAEMKETNNYKRADVIMQAGWATTPGATDSNRALARACAEKLSEGL